VDRCFVSAVLDRRICSVRPGRNARVPGGGSVGLLSPEELADSLIEEEFAYATAILDRTTQASPRTRFQPAPGIQHGPHNKVMIDPAFAMWPGGKQATVPFDPTKKAEGEISPALECQV
jgi:hypothetical protein